MNFKYSGFLFVLIVILEAISGLALNNTSIAKNTQDLSAVHPIVEKSQSESGATTESVKIILHNTSEIIPKSNVSENGTTTKTVTVSPTAVTTAATTNSSTTSASTATTTTTTETPVPVLKKGHWVVRNKTTNTICIIAEMAMQLNITYPGGNQLKSAIINIPENATSNGSCSEPLQSLNIMWEPGHSLNISFSANKTTNEFFISELSLYINATVFKDFAGDAKFWHFANSSSEFRTPLDMSYKCNKVQDIQLKSDENAELKAVLSLKDTQLEAYLNETKAEFGAAQDCDTFDTPDVVPIAVGCALAILVLVVLVAYLIGRKRSKNRGYLSM